MNSNNANTNAPVTPASPSASPTNKTNHDAGIVLPTGTIMSASEFNGEIDRMFDFKRKFQDAWSKGKSVLNDEWHRVESALSSFHEDDDDNVDDKDDAQQEEPRFKRIKLDESAIAASASTSPLTVESHELPKPAPLPAPFKASGTLLAPTTVVPEQPGQELTGVQFDLVAICATLCDQIYYATSLNNFQLTHPDDPTITAEPILFDDHGALRDVVPPMAVAIKDTTLIVVWRGSATIMDWVSDAGYAPSTSSRWNKVASSNVQAHSAYTSFVESDLSIHESYFVQLIQERNINTILLTGHSLAGGMANVAHLVLEGQLQTPGSLWHSLNEKLTVRSVAFAAPMTTLVNSSAESPVDETTRAFLAKIASNSCNLVYGPDIVPHGAGDITYSIDVANALVPEALKVVPYNWVMRLFGIQRKVNDALGNLLNKDGVRALAKVMVQYQHVSTVVYYPAPLVSDATTASATSTPVPLRDCQFLPDSIAEFRGNDLVRVPTVEKVVGGKNNDTVAVSKQLKVAHSFLMEAFAYNKADPVEVKA